VLMKDLKDLKIFNKDDFPHYLPKLNLLYDDLFSSGKGFRSRLIQMISKHLKLTEVPVHLMAQTIEFVHNASLLHDDLIDRSELRRSKPAAWLKYSPEYAVLAGDYLLARVMVNLSRYGNLRLIQYTAEMISDLLEGEWIQDSLVHDWRVGLDQLDQVHDLKTASLFKWCLRAPLFVGSTKIKTSIKHCRRWARCLDYCFSVVMICSTLIFATMKTKLCSVI
jgi:octaprenyl-diphosphate synthase